MGTKQVRKVLVVYYTRNYGTLAKVKKALQENRIAASYVKRENESTIRKFVGNADVIIVVGGDGTLLRTSHFVEDTPVLHISSSSRMNEAFFSRATDKDAERKIGLLSRGMYKIMPLMRLDASINGKRLPYKALNEVYAGSKESYHVARYTLTVGNIREEQKSSGVLIATPAGSHAWVRSAGGKKLPLTARKIEYVVREPYAGRLTKSRLIRGVIGGNQSIKAISKIWEKHRGIVVIDSYKKSFKFNKGDKLLVRAAKQPLNLISF